MTAKKPGPLPSRILPPPAPDSSVTRALNRHVAGRLEDGKFSRATGRTVQFATIVRPEFKQWMKDESKRRGMRMNVLLEHMRDAYIKVRSEENTAIAFVKVQADKNR